MFPKVFSSLPVRTGIIIAFCSTLLTLILATLLYNITIHEEVRKAQHQINQLFLTIENSAAIAAYLDNKELAEEVTKGLANNDIVAGAQLNSGSGMSIANGQAINKADSSLQKYGLSAPFMDDNKAGLLIIMPNTPYIDTQAKASARRYMFVLTIHAIIIIAVVISIIIYLLIKPLAKVAAELHKIEPGSELRVNCPQGHTNSEIGSLVNDANILLTATENTVVGERRLRQFIEELQQKTRVEAERDPLTSLYNRRAGEKAIKHAFTQATTKSQQCAIMLIDLDKFKPINDTYGHDAGDAVLIETAKRLSDSLRTNDVIIRWGGDEFLVLIYQGHNALMAETVAKKLLHNLSKPIDLGNGQEGNVGASIGISLFPQQGNNADYLIDLADKAMYHVKRSGRNNYAIYSTNMDQEDNASTIG